MTLPALIVPLVPPDTDCRGLPFMPLDVTRLRESDFAALASGDEFKAGLLLWCASWTQIPASSLPDDNRILARLAGYGLREWTELREMAMHGWIKCADGRLYHPVIAEKALEAYGKRVQQRERINARWAKAKQSKSTPDENGGDTAVAPATHTVEDTGECSAEVQGTGTGTGTKKESGVGVGARGDDDRDERPAPGAKPKAVATNPFTWPADAFDQFWAAYPHRVGKGGQYGALAKFKKLASNPPCSFEFLLESVQRYIETKPPRHAWCNPATWLNQERWNDQPAATGEQYGERSGADAGRPGAGSGGGGHQARVGSMQQGALVTALQRRR